MSIEQYLPFIIPLVVIQLGLMVFCLLDISKREKFKYLPKWGWVLVVVLGELVGPVVYLLIGRAEE
jgi:hypothetical protein